MKFSKEIQKKFVCPITKKRLTRDGDYLVSDNKNNIRYPIINGIPVLINEKNSIFNINDISENYNKEKENIIKNIIVSLFPDIGANVKAKRNYRKLIDMLPENSKILVIGGGTIGEGMNSIYECPKFEIIGSDIYFGPCNQLICDEHDIPFENESFDCVIVQAVLEHVLSPERCVREIHRVLIKSGILYAETPFIQQVHMRELDFTRFTHLGHRRLFNRFEEIDSGPCCGPGMALAWSYFYFLRSLVNSRKYIGILHLFSRITSFYLKYFDYYLIDKPGSYDAASGYFFMGRKSDHCLSDRELIKQFKGL